MVTEHVLPDLLERSGERAVIVSRSLKTWGTSESGLAEMIADAGRPADQPDDRVPGPGHRGHLRAHDGEGADRGRGARAARRRGRASCARCSATSCSRSTTRRWSRRCCASARRAAGRSASPSRSPAGSSARASRTCPARSRTFRGSIASYATEVKRDVLGVTAEHGRERGGGRADGRGRAARARRRRRRSRSPASPGPTSRTASRSARSGTASRSRATRPRRSPRACPFDRERIRQFSTISVLNLLRMRLLALP